MSTSDGGATTMGPTLADVLALTSHFQDVLFDAVFPHGAPRDDTDIPLAGAEDWAHEARAVAYAVAPFLRAVDGQLVPTPDPGRPT